MSRYVLPDLATGILIPLSIFVIFALGIETIIFAYLNQSAYTPQSELLTFWNTLLPYLLTITCIIYFTSMQIFNSLKTKKKNLFYLILAIFSGIIAVPWQIDWLLWHIQQDQLDYLYIGIWLLVLILTTGMVIDGVRTYWPRAKRSDKLQQ